MGDEIAFENGRISDFQGLVTFKGSWPWPWIGSYYIPSFITHRRLPTYQILLKSKKLCGRTNLRTDIWDPLY